MNNDYQEFENTLKELKSTSRTSLSMVILGALCLVASLIYSATRLAPLEEEIYKKTSTINQLTQTEDEYKIKIELAKNEYDGLRKNIEKMYATKVTSDNSVYELKAAAKATGVMTSDGPAYDFSVFINAPESTLIKIKKVKYLFNHPTFSRKSKMSDDAKNNFNVGYYGWGCLTKVVATLEFIGGEQQEIEFNMCQSLGPLWWNSESEIPSISKNKNIFNKQPIKKQSRTFSENEDCGTHWANWEEHPGKHSNPCPVGCTKANQVDFQSKVKQRTVQKLPFGQVIKRPISIQRKKFQCLRT